MGPRNAAIWYAQDGFDPAAKGINGRRVAGESFLKGFLRHAEVDEFVLLSKLPEDVEPVRALAEELRPGVPLRHASLMRQPTSAPCPPCSIPAQISPPRHGGARPMARGPMPSRGSRTPPRPKR